MAFDGLSSRLQEITKKYFQTAKDMVGKIANSSGKLPELMTCP